MVINNFDSYCPDSDLLDILDIVKLDNDDETLIKLDELLVQYPSDPRLHFLNGSVLASVARYKEALVEMGKAVELDTNYAIARFQLGFLHLTEGDVLAAEHVWHGLSLLDAEHPLRLFSKGLIALSGDQFKLTIELLEKGINLNQEYPLVNDDMRKVIHKVQSILQNGPVQEQEENGSHLLLTEYMSGNFNKH